MDKKSMIDKTIASGITPLRLKYDMLSYFENKDIILRSSLIIESLDLGVLTFDQYRFVARRGKKGDELVKRLIEKVFGDYANIKGAFKDLQCVSIPITPRMLLSGKVSKILHNLLSVYPEISPANICIELSSDVLFEDMQVVKQNLEEIKNLGVKIALFELGDEFCPLFKLSDLSLDYVFADKYIEESLFDEKTKSKAIGFVNYLHMLNVKVFVLTLSGDEQLLEAKSVNFDGYAIKKLSKEEVNDDL